MKLNGCEDFALEMKDGAQSLTITLNFKTPKQALEAFEALRKRTLDKQELELKLTFGDHIPEH